MTCSSSCSCPVSSAACSAPWCWSPPHPSCSTASCRSSSSSPPPCSPCAVRSTAGPGRASTATSASPGPARPGASSASRTLRRRLRRRRAQRGGRRREPDLVPRPGRLRHPVDPGQRDEHGGDLARGAVGRLRLPPGHRPLPRPARRPAPPQPHRRPARRPRAGLHPARAVRPHRAVPRPLRDRAVRPARSDQPLDQGGPRGRRARLLGRQDLGLRLPALRRHLRRLLRRRDRHPHARLAVRDGARTTSTG